MDIRVEGDKLYYGHFQGNLTSLDKNTGKIIWSSPFSITSNISLTSNSIIGSTTENMLISLDKTSGFLIGSKNLMILSLNLLSLIILLWSLLLLVYS